MDLNPKYCVDFVTREYVPWQVGLEPANHPKGRVHSSQDEGQHEGQHKQPAHGGGRVHAILHLVLFNTSNNLKLTFASQLSSPQTLEDYIVIGVGMGEIMWIFGFKIQILPESFFFHDYNLIYFRFCYFSFRISIIWVFKTS